MLPPSVGGSAGGFAGGLLLVGGVVFACGKGAGSNVAVGDVGPPSPSLHAQKTIAEMANTAKNGATLRHRLMLYPPCTALKSC
jgi:hypothetical protein